MRMTTLMATVALLSSAGRTLAQNTPEENNPNADAPFVQNIRADRPGQTITAQVLQPGRFQLETGTLRSFPKVGTGQLQSNATLRIGFFNSMELRVSQSFQHGSLGRPRKRGCCGRLVWHRWWRRKVHAFAQLQHPHPSGYSG